MKKQRALVVQVQRLPVFYKQRDNLFYPVRSSAPDTCCAPRLLHAGMGSQSTSAVWTGLGVRAAGDAAAAALLAAGGGGVVHHRVLVRRLCAGCWQGAA